MNPAIAALSPAPPSLAAASAPQATINRLPQGACGVQKRACGRVAEWPLCDEQPVLWGALLAFPRASRSQVSFLGTLCEPRCAGMRSRVRAKLDRCACNAAPILLCGSLVVLYAV